MWTGVAGSAQRFWCRATNESLVRLRGRRALRTGCIAFAGAALSQAACRCGRERAYLTSDGRASIRPNVPTLADDSFPAWLAAEAALPNELERQRN